MRTFKIALATGLLGVFTLAAPACKWTDFDDLETESWVESTEKPNSNSNDYGVALAPSVRASASGGTLIVLGAGQALYTELDYKAAGGADLVASTELKLNTQFAIGNLDVQPILITSPDSDEAALITNSGGNGSIAVLKGEHGLMSSQIFGPTSPDAATYFVGIGKTVAAPIVAADDADGFGAVFGPPVNNTQPKCLLVDDAAMPIETRGIAGVKITKTDSDDIVVWNSDGKLFIFDGAAFDGCVGTAAPISTAVDVGFAPAKNASMHVLDGKYVMLAGRKESGDGAFVAIYDVTAVDPLMPLVLKPTLVGAPLDRAGIRSTAILDVAGQRYLIAGFPLATVDATTSGEVLAFPFDTTAGITPTPAMTLHDAQPESNQTYGRAVAVFQYNGKSILAVSADNEIFAYYQTPLYGETRLR